MSIVHVDCSTIADNPHCPHGPMVKFTKRVKNATKVFYGCSACRDPKECPFHLNLGEVLSEAKLRVIAEAKSRLSEGRSSTVCRRVRRECGKLEKGQRRYCRMCFEFVLPVDKKRHKGHDLLLRITDKQLRTPSFFLAAKTNDKKEAQYWFDGRTKTFLASIPSIIGANAVLCVGTPTVFEILHTKNVPSFLLDIDSRYMTFYDVHEFAWFNMFNFHFLSDETENLKNLQRLLDTDKTCIILDPPFGCRLELLSYTVDRLRQLCTGESFVFLVLPYFMEPRVLQYFPNFEMSDYVLHYENHSKMKQHKNSAVRFFTDAPPSILELPSDEGYRHCSKCDRWRHPSNRHCDICGTCPSKNATTYKHCDKCATCVKQSWQHCDDCERCFLAPHKCHDNPQLLKRKRTEKLEKRKRKKK
ncbi:unnamed protein product [Nesidiocoris tenuis]|uniref:CTCHY-type domain-containing protein n=1 Tax=Nesidiocoris tenuis TaxID=355587 RepID=A0A6H5GQS6_9HEMI|nr:unnamed protein product [Nesidiocoris tenuis]